MKIAFVKTFATLAIIFPLFFLSCSNLFDMEIPETVSVKTDANYNFGIGEHKLLLSKYINVQKLQNKLTGLSDDLSDIKIYEYNPEGENRNYESFIIHYPLMTYKIEEPYLTLLSNAVNSPIAHPPINLPVIDDTVDLNINMAEMVEGLHDGIADKIAGLGIKELPIYVYMSAPKKLADIIDADVDLSINYATANSSVMQKSLMSSQGAENATIKTSPFSFSGTTYTQKLPSSSVNADPSTLSDVVNQRADLKNIDYAINITLDTSRSSFLQSDIENNKEIQIDIVVEIPLVMTAVNDISFDVLDLLKDDDSNTQDFFRRDEQSDIEELEEHSDAIEYVSIDYNIDNNFFKAKNTSGMYVIFQAQTYDGNTIYKKMEFNSSGPKSFRLSSDESIAALKTYPFNPTLTMNIPQDDYYMPKNGYFDISLSAGIKTNGTVKIFGD